MPTYSAIDCIWQRGLQVAAIVEQFCLETGILAVKWKAIGGVSCLTWNQSHGPLSSMCFKLTKSALDITILADKQRTLQRQYTAIWYRGTTDIPLSIHLPFIGFILTNVPLPPDILTVLQGKLLSGATADASTDDAFSCLLHVWIASIAVSKS
jgi:hypothetical protein